MKMIKNNMNDALFGENEEAEQIEGESPEHENLAAKEIK